MSADSDQQLKEIRVRLNEHREHYNDSYDFDLGEIPAIRELEKNAPQDIKFLLEEIERLNTELYGIPFRP